MYYAPEPEPPSEIIVASPEQETARLDFLKALMEIDKYGFAGNPVEGNPLQRLRSEVWPKWHEATHSPKAGKRRRHYLDSLSAQHVNRAAEILDQWATDCGLVESVQDAAPRPAAWVVAYAKQFCAVWSRAKLGQDEPLGWAKGYRESRGRKKEGEVTLASVDATRVAPSGIFVPMEYPAPHLGESWKTFRKRARSALTAHLHVWEHTRALTDPEPIGAGGSASRIHRRKRDGLEHYRYLALRLCCRGWSLKKIAEPVGLSVQAVSQGLHAKAKLVGLIVRNKR